MAAAERLRKSRGRSERVTFRVRSEAAIDGAPYDLILSLGGWSGLLDPAAECRSVAREPAWDGTWLIVAPHPTRGDPSVAEVGLHDVVREHGFSRWRRGFLQDTVVGYEARH